MADERKRRRWPSVVLALAVLYPLSYLSSAHEEWQWGIKRRIYHGRTMASMFLPAAWREAQLIREVICVTSEDRSEESPFGYYAEPLFFDDSRMSAREPAPQLFPTIFK